MKKQLIIAVRRRVASTRSSVLGPRPWGASLLGVRRLGWAWALAWGSAWGWARGWPWAGLGPRFGAGLGARPMGWARGSATGSARGCFFFWLPSGLGFLGLCSWVGLVGPPLVHGSAPLCPPAGPPWGSNGRASAPIVSQTAPRSLFGPSWAPHGPPMGPHREPIGARSGPQWAQIGPPWAPHRPLHGPLIGLDRPTSAPPRRPTGPLLPL